MGRCAENIPQFVENFFSWPRKPVPLMSLRNARQCAMHQREGTGCRIGTCQQSNLVWPSVAKATLAEPDHANESFSVELVPPALTQFAHRSAIRPPVPPPRRAA